MTWYNKKLIDIAEVRVSNVDKKFYATKQLVRLCNYMDAYSNDYITSKIDFTTGSADFNQLSRFGLKKNDVIITKDSETPEDIAVSSVVNEEIENLVCGYHLAILRPFEDEVDGTFLMQKLKLPEVKNYFFRVANGSTRFGMTIGDIENVPITLPKVAVQKEIANIIRRVDTVIKKTEQAISKYKCIKQGMLHDFFTRGIDANGKLRPTAQEAPELYKPSALGLIPNEWGCVIFSSIADIINGGTPSTAIAQYWNGDIPWLAVDDFNYSRRFVEKTKKKISEEGFKNSATNLLPEKAIIISARGTVGVIAQLFSPMSFNQSCYGIISIETSVSNDFLYYYLLFHKKFKGFSSFGSVFNTITREYFDELFIAVPSQQYEKDRIVENLTSIDLSIENEEKALEKYRDLKQGLMADLLTGKKEVKLNEGMISKKELIAR